MQICLAWMSGMAWAAGSVVIRRYPKADFLHVTFMQYLIGGLLAGGAAIVMGDAIPTISHVLAAHRRCVSGIGSGVFAICIIDFRIMQYLSPGLVGILMLSEVLVAVLSSWVFLHETLTPMAIGWGGGYFGHWRVCWPD